MGNRTSRTFWLAYEDGVKKLSSEEQQRLENCFKRYRTYNNDVLAFRTFRERVLAESVPEPIAQQLFIAFGGTGRGLSYKDLVVGLVVLTKCTQEERIKLLFHLFSDDGEWVVMHRVAEKLKEAEPTGKISPRIQSSIASTEKLNAADFQRWIVRFRGEIPIAEWILDCPPALSNLAPMTTFYQTLAGVTHLNEKEIVDLEQHWWRIADQRILKMNVEKFSSLVSPPVPSELVQPLFSAFDDNQDAQIDFKELVCGLSACCRGPSVDRHKFCFKVFDTDRDGYLSKDDVKFMTTQLLRVRSEVFPELLQEDDASMLDPEEIAKSLMDAYNSTEDERLSLGDFLLWANSSPLPDNFLQLLFELCHVVLGLKPDTKETEGTIVKSWANRLDRGGLAEGQMWYLISREWWTQWEQWMCWNQTPLSSRTATPVPTPPIGGRKNQRGSVVAWNETNDSVTITAVRELDTSHLIQNQPGVEPLEICTNGPSTSSAPATPPLSPASRADTHSSEGSGRESPRRSILGRSWSPCPRQSISPARVPVKPTKPGIIDNQPLLCKEKSGRPPSLTQEGGLLRSDLMVAGRDFQLVDESLWQALCRWYGGGSPALPRKVILDPKDKNVKLELYPVTLTVLRHQNTGPGSYTAPRITGGPSVTGVMSTVTGAVTRSLQEAARDWAATTGTVRRVPMHSVTFSKVAKVKDVFDYLCRTLRLNPDTARLWLVVSSDESNWMILEDEELSFTDLEIKTGSQLLLEVRNRDLTWPEEISFVARNYQPTKLLPASDKGVTGLSNLGNTCYMNAAVQCVSNTQPLTQYFLRSIYRYELNKENVLGMKGHIALAYASLVQDLWSARTRALAPLKLKNTIAKYASRFNDVNQHDCQELLAFLLDGLHEDLNRVHQKPYTELKDSDGRPDEVVAAEAWDNHLKRNQSVIVDLFHGLLKSEVSCKECSHTSVRFDPFTFLSLPLPLDNFVLLQVAVMKLDGSMPVRYGLRIPAEEDLLKLRDRLNQLCGLPSHQMILVELSNNGQIHKFPCLDEKVKRLTSAQNSCFLLYAFQVPPAPIAPDSEVVDTAQIAGGYTNGHVSVGHIRSASSVSMASNASSLGSTSFPKSEETPNFGSAYGYTLALHRKMEHSDQYFLAHHRALPVIFGLPLVLPADLDHGTAWSGRGLYQSVWSQVSRLVSPQAKQQQGNPVNHAMDWYSDEDLNAEFPFTLRVIKKSGVWCAKCAWFKFCYGCEIPLDSERVDMAEGTFVAVDWDMTAVHLRYQHSLEMVCTEHESVKQTTDEHMQPISLDSCLKAFTTPEELSDKDTYYCSKCKTHRPARKKLSIWKLPPVLVVHFKRFQFVYNRWVKSSKMVVFPKENFCPTDYLASAENEGNTGLGDSEQNTTNLGTGKSVVLGAIGGIANICRIGDGKRINGNNNSPRDGSVIVGETNGNSDEDGLILPGGKKTPKSPIKKLIHKAGSKDTKEGKDGADWPDGGVVSNGRIRTESTASVLPMCSPNEHRLKEGFSPENLDYDLYAIACHYGVLGAGHYVSYAKNPNKRWYLYNDSRCKEVNPVDIDGNYAYLLFFERKGLDYASYIPEVKERIVESEENGGTNEDDSSSDPDNRCSVQ